LQQSKGIFRRSKEDLDALYNTKKKKCFVKLTTLKNDHLERRKKMALYQPEY